MIFKGGCVILLLFAFNLVLADKSVDYKGVYVKVLGQSGKIVVGNTPNPDADPNSVKIEFDEIKEKDSNGSEVGKSEATHSFNTFASQNFTISDTADVKYLNINATMFNFTANLASVNATLVVSVYIFKEDGNVTVANEMTNIKVGNVKFNIDIMNWKFCGSSGVTCNQGQRSEVGTYIDFVIVIKGKGSASKSSKRASDGDEYNLGGGAGIILSKKVRYDGKDWTNMTAAYPTMITTGTKQSFTFRFEKFNSSVQYDPTVTVGGSVDAASGSTLSSSTLCALLAMALFYFLF